MSTDRGVAPINQRSSVVQSSNTEQRSGAAGKPISPGQDWLVCGAAAPRKWVRGSATHARRRQYTGTSKLRTSGQEFQIKSFSHWLRYCPKCFCDISCYYGIFILFLNQLPKDARRNEQQSGNVSRKKLYNVRHFIFKRNKYWLPVSFGLLFCSLTEQITFHVSL